MEEYYFLFAIALLFTGFASIQDLRKREVANWLNFSLIGFGFAYRLFYSIIGDEYNFLFFGFIGFAIFFVLANVFYYGKVFAGGDAKLLMGFGVILPYESYYDVLFTSMGFIVFLFAFGAIYSLIYSSLLAFKNKKQFYIAFKRKFIEKKSLVYIALSFDMILIISLVLINDISYFVSFGIILLFFMPLIYIYLLSIETSCMIVLLSPSKLTEGDWLEKDVRVGNKLIKKSVHGLSYKEIKFLKKYNKKVFVKQGVPFVPAFFFALVTMVFFYLFLGESFQSLFFSI
jgi:Flp pilus assembly protein protease CpaA